MLDPRRIKEFESLVMRIASPRGNAVSGKLPHSDNPFRSLSKKVHEAQEKQIDRIFGVKKSGTKASSEKRSRLKREPGVRGSKRTYKPRDRAVLEGLFPKRMRLIVTYKGKTHTAHVRRDGYITYDGNVFSSPSLAGRAITGRPTNGWDFWSVEMNGTLRKLRELRHNKESAA